MNDNWGYMVEGDDDNMHFEDGTVRPLNTTDFTLPWGKYKDLTLAEVTDLSYLTWLKKTVVPEKQDWFMDRIVSMRIKELT